jgi:hypothetical protein
LSLVSFFAFYSGFHTPFPFIQVFFIGICVKVYIGCHSQHQGEQGFAEKGRERFSAEPRAFQRNKRERFSADYRKNRERFSATRAKSKTVSCQQLDLSTGLN